MPLKIVDKKYLQRNYLFFQIFQCFLFHLRLLMGILGIIKKLKSDPKHKLNKLLELGLRFKFYNAVLEAMQKQKSAKTAFLHWKCFLN